jgi:hypothetical protein
MKRWPLIILTIFTLAACAGAAQPVASPLASPVMTPAVPAAATPIAPTEPARPTPTTGGRVAVFPEPIIVYQREGGFAGTSDKWTIYQTGRIVAGDGTEWQVPAEQVASLFKLVESPAFGELNEKYAPIGTCNDCFTYTLTVYGPDQPQTVIFIDGADFPPLGQQLLAQLNSITTPPTK